MGARWEEVGCVLGEERGDVRPGVRGDGGADGLRVRLRE